MEALMNRVRFEAERVQNLKAPTRLGTVSSYDPANYAVKVLLQPDGTETGFIPFGANMVGNGWGVFFAPSPGDQVAVTFQEDGHEVPLAAFCIFDNTNRPLSVPSGEMWLVHQTGAFVKLLTNGNVNISSPNMITIDAGTGGISMNTPASVAVTAPVLSSSGNLSAGTGATGTFSSSTGQVITVSDGIVTNIY